MKHKLTIQRQWGGKLSLIFWYENHAFKYITNIFEALTETCHACLLASWTPSHLLAMFFVHHDCLFFLRPLLDTSECLNSEKTNVPKQPRRRLGRQNTGCVTRIPSWMKFLLVPYFIALRRTPNACFYPAVWKYQAHALLHFNIQVFHYPG